MLSPGKITVFPRSGRFSYYISVVKSGKKVGKKVCELVYFW
jgi:hypothetical protein